MKMAAKLLVAFMFGFLLYFVSAVPERGVKEMCLKVK